MDFYMTIEIFEQLSEDEKLKTLLSSGRAISERKSGQYRSFLYNLGSFYAVVAYHVDTDELKSIQSFERMGSQERIQWKMLRVLSEPRSHFKNNNSEGYL